MPNTADESKMPLSLAVINIVGGAFVLTGVILMFVTKPTAASGTRSLFEALMTAGVLCYLVYVVRYW